MNRAHPPLFLVQGLGVLFGLASVAAAAEPQARRFDFGDKPAAEGYVAVRHDTSYTPGMGYGWTHAPDALRDRTGPDALRRDFVFSRSPATFRVNVVPGVYRMTIVTGDLQYGDHVLNVAVPAEKLILPELHPGVREFITLTTAFAVKSSPLELRFDSPDQNWALNALTLAPADKPAAPTVVCDRLLVDVQAADTWPDIASWPDPIAPYVRQFREVLPDRPPLEPSGLTRQDYLGVIAGVVDYFRSYQDENGAIIDPYRKVEYQYATPCFALAAATLVSHANRAELLEPAARAMDWAVWTLSQRKAATAHEDFFAPQIAHALPLLSPHVAPERAERWKDQIRSFDPYHTYRAAPGGGNWNVVNLSGEGLFCKLGLRPDASYVEHCIAAQGRWFNSPLGLYVEGPMAYDHFPRIWAADLLASGFTARGTDRLAEVLRRGALTSLFLQSPTGELPTGGRSAHHQWNEAEQCLTYEIYAANAKAGGDTAMAGVFKRAAHLALGSVQRWIRPSGELWIVKNRCDPADNHGYEGYSSHSQYNLLAMAMLAIAYEHAAATEDVPERPCPADVGGFVLELPAPHNKVIANAGGMYVEIDYAADLAFNPTGLLRVHRAGFNPQLGPSDGLTAGAVYRLPEGDRTTAAVGVAWKDPERWRRLAELGRPHGKNIEGPGLPAVSLRRIVEVPRRVRFELVYDRPSESPSRIVEQYDLSPERAVQTVKIEGYTGPTRLVWPVLAHDGAEETEIRVSDSRVLVSLRRQTQVFQLIGADSVRVEETRYPFRNGWARLAIAEYPSGACPGLWIAPLPGERSR